MTASDTPQWLQTVTRKRKIRDEAILSFTEAHKSPELEEATSIDEIDKIQQGILSGGVTAVSLCIAYINR
jgi:amidase